MPRYVVDRECPDSSDIPSNNAQQVFPWRISSRRSDPPGIVLAALVVLAALPFDIAIVGAQPVRRDK